MWFSSEKTVDLTLFGHTLSILQDNETVHVGTTVWEASLSFATWLEKHASDPGHPFSRKEAQGKRAIELGTGCGISAFALALLGCDVLATDIQAVVPILKKNIKRNMTRISQDYLSLYGPPGKVKPMILNWGNKKHIEGVKPPFDIVIATDVVYLEDIVTPLIQTLLAVSSPTSIICLGYRLRQQEAHDLFWAELPLHFEVTKVPRDELSENFKFDEVDLYMLKKITK